LDYLVASVSSERPHVEKLAPNEVTYKELKDRGLTEGQIKTFVNAMMTEKKISKRMAFYQGRNQIILTWLGEVETLPVKKT
jgi:hypothetical protein